MPAHQHRPSTVRNLEVLAPVGLAVAAIILMPFVAGRHPSGAQTVLVLAACIALTTISLSLLTYAGRRAAERPGRDAWGWPPPDELSARRERHSG